MTGTKRRSTRQAASRSNKRSRYVDPDTDDDFDFDDEGEANYAPPEAARSSSRHQQHGIPLIPRSGLNGKQKMATGSKPRPLTRSSKTNTRQTSIRSIGAVRKANAHRTAAPKKGFTGPGENKTPEWTSLPVDILRDIFVYASQPLDEATTTAIANTAFLMRAARTCRSFALPALEAYYLSPALHTSLQPHHFLELLQMPKDRRYIDYNVKVQSLCIDVRRLAYTASHRGLFDLSTLVAEIPQLHHVEVRHVLDAPPFRTFRQQGWTYPQNLFSALDDGGHKLKSWRWGRDMIAQSDPAAMYISMVEVHSRRSFQPLNRLVVRGFNVKDSSEPQPQEEVGEALPGLASAIAVLPLLKDLTFVSCDIIMEKFLQRLPQTLERLELTNCLELHSAMLKDYFITSGSQLRELVLNHNPALDLTFLTALKAGCPKLQVLKMDSRYYSERVNSNDADPLYDTLLGPDDVPTWPTTLRHLELVHLLKWTKQGAENLFRSVIDAAGELPDLRHLVLQSHISIPWRDRAGFREQWIERLQRVFQRKEEPPALYGSIKEFRLWKQGLVGDASHPTITDSDDEPLVKRKPASVKAAHAELNHDTATGSCDEHQPRRSKRVPTLQSQNSRVSISATEGPTSESEEDAAASVAGQSDWRSQLEKCIQALCAVVDIRIDNQRPRENQFTEGDFLDAEASGDDDWHESADEAEEEGYAW